MNLDITVILKSVITMTIILLVGYFSCKLKLIDDVFLKKISNFVICVGQPFLILSSVLSIPYSDENIKTGFFILALGIISLMVFSAVAFISAVKFKDIEERKLIEFAIIFSNCGFMGFPILKEALGEIGVFWGSFYVIAFNIVTWTYGMIVLNKARPEIKINFRKIFINYGTVPCVVGIALYCLRFEPPAPVYSAMNSIGSLCTPLSLILIGGILSRVPVKKLFINLKVYYTAFIKLIIIPVIAVLLGRLCRLPSELYYFSVIMAALPTASNTAMFAESYDIKPEFAAHIVGIITLLSVGTVPLVMYLAKLIETLI